jgi:hypothetical protein
MRIRFKVETESVHVTLFLENNNEVWFSYGAEEGADETFNLATM